MAHRELELPPHFDPDRVGEVWKVPYEERAAAARVWAREHDIRPAAADRTKIALVAVDVQNTFCIPEFELYVGGRTGSGAIDDNRRLCEFIYRNLDVITQIVPTMDTHHPLQIFHAIFLVDEAGNHPAPYTLVSAADIAAGRWRFNPAIRERLGLDERYGPQHLEHYTHKLQASGQYDLTIWPYHAMLGGIGHALVSAVEEAIFFHSVARYTQPDFQIKGDNPLTEHYSMLGPEVLQDADGRTIGRRNSELVQSLLGFDAVVIAGQAKSHCVAWTIDHLLEAIRAQDARLASRVYLLDDCSSPVVIPDVIDYTDQADAAFRRFADAGMHIVRSSDPIDSWPKLAL